ncbi:hypothetical protein L873DRAFT_1790974 [Choiromyces venosus 120613-1]|uniref:Uncharacterized protein n=1 Tax=Choiromyces venosus 120613-1 TaxID=1336337 RepID=A0A3N4JGU4_9PEZI|nr:hypothetical protein L873DRAFT_1790974 [Choiromyces venosus 120613-1]
MSLSHIFKRPQGTPCLSNHAATPPPSCPRSQRHPRGRRVYFCPSTATYPPPASSPTSIGAPSWATVTGKGKKKAPATLKPTLAAKPTSSANAPMPKKGITMRERRLVIKHDGSLLTPTAMELQDAINTMLSFIYIQTVSFTGGNITLTNMETIKVTSLKSKASAFHHLIPPATTIHLDTLATQLLVHSLPT